MMTHTPGPWKQGKAAGSIIADRMPEINFEYQQEHLVYYGGLCIAESVAPCNRPLIIAAPDLLEACKMAVETFDDDAPGPGLSERGALKLLKTAIAKAEPHDNG